MNDLPLLSDGEIINELKVHKPSSGIVFSASDGPWIMQIKEDNTIAFNREDYPDLAADDFAEKVIYILENSAILR